MVEATIRTVDGNVPVTTVWASRGKAARAEPVSALYEQGRIHHIGTFPKLEDQMCAFTTDFDRARAGYSPDRLDALVWGLTELLVEPMPNYGIFDGRSSPAPTRGLVLNGSECAAAAGHGNVKAPIDRLGYGLGSQRNLVHIDQMLAQRFDIGLVWGLTELSVEPMPSYGFLELMRQRAGAPGTKPSDTPGASLRYRQPRVATPARAG